MTQAAAARALPGAVPTSPVSTVSGSTSTPAGAALDEAFGRAAAGPADGGGAEPDAMSGAGSATRTGPAVEDGASHATRSPTAEVRTSEGKPIEKAPEAKSTETRTTETRTIEARQADAPEEGGRRAMEQRDDAQTGDRSGLYL